MSFEPDRRLIIQALEKTYYVDLREGWIWSEIRVWRDVWPAIGGTLGRVRVRRRDGVAQWEKLCQRTQTILDNAEASLIR